MCPCPRAGRRASCWSRSLGQHGGARPILSLDHRRFAQRCGMVEGHAEEEATSAGQPAWPSRTWSARDGRGAAELAARGTPATVTTCGRGASHSLEVACVTGRHCGRGGAGLCPSWRTPPRLGQERGCLDARPCCVSPLPPPPARRLPTAQRPWPLGWTAVRGHRWAGLGENRGLLLPPRLSCLSCPSLALVLPLPHLGPGQQWPQCR